MKSKLIYIAILIGLFYASCEPMKDIKEEIDEANGQQYTQDTFNYNRILAPESYTLTDEDYLLSSNESVRNYQNFSATNLPKDYLPEILNKLFVAENAQEMLVTYNYYAPIIVDEEGAYELTEADYISMGQTYLNFENEDEASFLIGKLLDRIAYVTDAGTEMTVKYTKYEKNLERFLKVVTPDSVVVLENSDDPFVLDTIHYDTLGCYYPNFNDIEDAMEKLPILADTLNHTLPKEYSCKVYKNYFDEYIVYTYNGTNWVVKEIITEVTEPLNYDLNETDITLSTWWADPAIKVTLTGDDYALFPETASYSNFDLRGGNVPGTDRDKLVEMIGQMMDANHAPIIEDQQYLVTYVYYDGASGVGSIRIIKTAGVWTEYVEE
jgi:hypothetical protein